MQRADELRAEIAHQARQIRILGADIEVLRAKISRIGIDLEKTAAQFQLEVGGGAGAHAQWRKRASRALESTEAKLIRTSLALEEAHKQRNLAEMMLLSYESGYRGRDTMGLLRATYLLLMKLVEDYQYAPNEEQLGLISTVQIHCGYEIPGGQHDG